MSIQPEYITFEKLLHGKLFRIPNYQRYYSWENKQRNDLFNDIEKIKDTPSQEHFMATVVCLDTNQKKAVGSDQFSILDIVDGQQRITTLIILLKAISKELNIDKMAEETKKVDEILVKKDDRLILLQTNHDYSRYFEDYIRKGNIPKKNELKTATDKNLFHALDDCENYVKKWKEKSSLIDLLSILKNRLCFILQTVKEEGSVYTIFEVLNSRGLEVDWLDKCKSSLMGLLFESATKSASNELLNELHKTWSEIYKVIGLTKVPGHEIIRFAATLKYEDVLSKTLSAEDSLEFFRDYCSKNKKEVNIAKIKEITSWLLKVTQKLVELYNNKRLKTVTEITQARLLAIAILLRDDLINNEKNKLLEQWERITFRIYGMFGKDSRTKVGDYVRTAQKVHSNKIEARDLIKEIKEIGKDYLIKDAIKELEKSDCYNGWGEELRYFFYRYEQYCAEKNGGTLNEVVWNQIWEENVNSTIEHIYPQGDNAQTLPQWKGKISGNASKHVNRLGNLILLPPEANSQAGQKSFKEKKEIYKNNPMFLMQDIMKLRDWNSSAIEKREKMLLKWAKKAWDDIS